MKKTTFSLLLLALSFSAFSQVGLSNLVNPPEFSRRLSPFAQNIPLSTQTAGNVSNGLQKPKQQPIPELTKISFLSPSLSSERSSNTYTNMENQPFFSNRRNKYSSLWAFTSLNYLYADLVGLMDANLLLQYQTGTVNGIDISPGFLTGAAAFMQIPLANVFLPQVIKNEKALRWVQIVSGAIMTGVQTATLFVGDQPAPYYILFSAIEIGTTAYITWDAIKWKPGNK